MESFFLAETTKYLYLLFDEHNFIHQSNGSVEQKIKPTLSPSCTIGSAGYIFNTEAHPIDIGAIHCCSVSKLTSLPEGLRMQTRLDKRATNGISDTFTGSYTCKGRPFNKKLSVLGAFIEGSEELTENS